MNEFKYYFLIIIISTKTIMGNGAETRKKKEENLTVGDEESISEDMKISQQMEMCGSKMDDGVDNDR